MTGSALLTSYDPSPDAKTQQQRRNIGFERPCILLVEGFADQHLTSAILSDMGTADDWQLHCMKGKNTPWGVVVDLVLKDPSFIEGGRAIGLVRDADDNPGGAFASCASILDARSLPTPDSVVPVDNGSLRTGVFVVPSTSRPGAVEELIWDAAEPERRGLADAFVSSVEAQLGPLHRPMKNRVQAYYAAQFRAIDSTTKAVYRQDVIAPGSPAFEPYREFLMNLGAPLS